MKLVNKWNENVCLAIKWCLYAFFLSFIKVMILIKNYLNDELKCLKIWLWCWLDVYEKISFENRVVIDWFSLDSIKYED